MPPKKGQRHKPREGKAPKDYRDEFTGERYRNKKTQEKKIELPNLPQKKIKVERKKDYIEVTPRKLATIESEKTNFINQLEKAEKIEGDSDPFIELVKDNLNLLSKVVKSAFTESNPKNRLKLIHIFSDGRLVRIRDTGVKQGILKAFCMESIFLPIQSIVNHEIKDPLVLLKFLLNMARFGFNPSVFTSGLLDAVYGAETMENYQRKLNELTSEYKMGLESLDEVSRKIDVYPSFEQISHTDYKPNFKNKYQTGYQNYEDILEFSMQMNKEDYMTPLRKAIQELRDGSLDDRDMFMYQNVHVIDFRDGSQVIDVEASCFLKFECRFMDEKFEKRVNNILKTGRFDYNSLLIIAEDPDCYVIKALALSKVRYRSGRANEIYFEELINKQYIVPVLIENGSIEAGKRYFMFEIPYMWSSCSAIQKALIEKSKMKLQNIKKISLLEEYIDTPLEVASLPSSPFPKDLLEPVVKHNFVEKTTHKVKFDKAILIKQEAINEVIKIKDQYEENYRRHFSINPLTLFGIIRTPEPAPQWSLEMLNDDQKDRYLRLDHQQYEALNHAMNYPLTVVNGDPGTGKTYLAREIIRAYLMSNPSKPIYIVTQTNHALDSLLEDVIEFTHDNFVRHGGRPRTENKKILEHRVFRGMMTKELKEFDFFRKSRDYRQNLYKEQTVNKVSSNFLEFYNKIARTDPQKFIDNSVEISDEFIQIADPVFDYIPILSSFIESEEKIRVEKGDLVLMWLRGKSFRDAVNDNFQKTGKFKTSVKYNSYPDEVQYLPFDKGNYPRIVNAKNKKFDDGTRDESDNEDKEDDIQFNAGAFIGNRNDKSMVDRNEHWSEPEFNSLTISSALEKAISKKLGSQNQLLCFLKKACKILNKQVDIYQRERKAIEIKRDHAEARAVGRVYQSKNLIALTATVAAVYSESLEMCSPEMMIIEEAGELTEAAFFSIIPSSVKHLVMIGDYNQLRPKVEYKLTKDPFNYDISTHERLVKALYYRNTKRYEPKVESLKSLTIQRRMHPDISSLLRKVFFDRVGDLEYKDDTSTREFGMAYGVNKRLQLILHQFNQSNAQNSRSYTNDQEATLAINIAIFLLHRGYKPSEITIVALYRGQMYNIKKRLMERKEIIINTSENDSTYVNPFFRDNDNEIPVVCLDNFQGEENKVIIISTTRSERLGFLSARQRVLVTLSRAREMMIILGNENILAKQDESNIYWPKVVQYAISHNETASFSVSRPGIGQWGFCAMKNENDQNGTIYINSTDDFEKYKFGSSNEKCNKTKKCGHVCKLSWHFCKCEDFPCQEPCSKLCLNCGCPCGLSSGRKCHECQDKGCPPCENRIPALLDCGHQGYIVCSSKEQICHETCTKRAMCGHPCSLICGHEGNCKCNVVRNSICVRCGHLMNVKCGDKECCNKPCITILPCGHKCPGECGICAKRGFHNKCNVRGCNGLPKKQEEPKFKDPPVFISEKKRGKFANYSPNKDFNKNFSESEGDAEKSEKKTGISAYRSIMFAGAKLEREEEDDNDDDI